MNFKILLLLLSLTAFAFAGISTNETSCNSHFTIDEEIIAEEKENKMYHDIALAANGAELSPGAKAQVEAIEFKKMVRFVHSKL